MFLVKVLERKEVIRFFGISLILAPFVNNLVKVALLNTVINRWTLQVFWQVFKTSALSIQIMSVASIIIGALMLSGSQKAWRYTLFLLGCHIIDQLLDFGPAYRANKIVIVFFLINVAVFLFIADQLVWKVKAKTPVKKGPNANPLHILREGLAKEKPLPNRIVQSSQTVLTNSSQSKPAPVPFPYKEPTPEVPVAHKVSERKTHSEARSNVVALKPAVPQKSSKSIPIQFEGFGSWARLSKITPKGIHMQSLTDLPFEFGSRQISVQFASGMSLRIRFSKREGQDFFFEFVDLSNDQVQQINSWLKRVA